MTAAPPGPDRSSTPAVALSIAGSDSGGGAGLQVDVKTMTAFGVLATTAVTAVTAQNTTAVLGVHVVPPDVVDLQITAVVSDLPVAATKTGMLAGPGTVAVVAAQAAAGHLPLLVVDPVLAASTGRPLMPDGGVDALRELLLPHAHVVTPNLAEAALLAGMDPLELDGPDAMTEAAFRIAAFGPRWIVVKGGHLPPRAGTSPSGTTRSGGGVPDVVCDARSGTATVHVSPWVESVNTHGTGCTLSAAITAGLAKGLGAEKAIGEGRRFVHAALLGAAQWCLGAGHGPLDHFAADHSP